MHLSMIIHYTVEKNIFCRYCLHAFSTAGIFKSHVNNYFKNNNQQINKIHEKVNMLISKIIKGK